MEELLMCSVCCEQYCELDRCPVVLPRCGHSFCRPCITLLVTGGCIVCPTCRTDQRIESTQKLPTEYTLLAIIQAQNNNKLTACPIHEVKLSFWCRTCSAATCGECLFEDHPTHSHDVIRATRYISEMKDQAQDIAKKFMDILDKREKSYYKTIFTCSRKINNAIRNVNVLRKDIDEARSLMQGIHEQESITAASSLAEAAKFLGLKWNIQDANFNEDSTTKLKEENVKEEKERESPVSKDTKRAKLTEPDIALSEKLNATKEEKEKRKKSSIKKSRTLASLETLKSIDEIEDNKETEKREEKEKEKDGKLVYKDKIVEHPSEKLMNLASIQPKFSIRPLMKSKTSIFQPENAKDADILKSECKLKPKEKEKTPSATEINSTEDEKASVVPKINKLKNKSLQNDDIIINQESASKEDIQKQQKEDVPKQLKEDVQKQPKEEVQKQLKEDERKEPKVETEIKESNESEEEDEEEPAKVEESNDTPKETQEQPDKIDLEAEAAKTEEKLMDIMDVPSFNICCEGAGGRLARTEWSTKGLLVFCHQFHHVPYDVCLNSAMLMAMIPSQTPVVFLELSLEDTVIGRVFINLWGYLKRAHNFLSLCLGDKGPSYLLTKFLQVYNFDKPGERILGGDYELNNGRGGKGLIDDLEWNGDYTQFMDTGMITAAGSGQAATNSLFLICTKSDSSRNFSCPFGRIISGMEYVQKAIRLAQDKEVWITDCGVLIEPPK